MKRISKSLVNITLVMALFLIGLNSVPGRAAIPIIIADLPPNDSWEWGVNVNDTIGINMSIYLPEYNANYTGLNLLRINSSEIYFSTEIGEEIVNLTAYDQRSSLDPAFNGTIDTEDDPYYECVNFTNEYMALKDVNDTFLLLCVPRNVTSSSLNLSWVGAAMLNSHPTGVENYADLGFNNYKVVGNRIEWWNSSSQDYINITFFDNGTINSADFYINYTSLYLRSGQTIIGNLSRFYDYSPIKLIYKTYVNAEENDLLYYRRSSLGSQWLYLQYNITDIYYNYSQGLGQVAAIHVNATASSWNRTKWDPFLDDNVAENPVCIANNMQIAFTDSFGSMALLFPNATNSSYIYDSWEPFWGGYIGLPNVTQGELWVNWTSVDGQFYTYIEMTPERHLAVYEINVQLGNNVYNSKYEKVAWPRDFYNNNFTIQTDETMVYNLTRNFLTASPSTSYERHTIVSNENAVSAQGAAETNPGTVIRASYETSPTYGSGYYYTGTTDDGYASEGRPVFLYSGSIFLTYIFPTGTNGTELLNFCFWYRSVLQADIINVSQYSVSIQNSTWNMWFNITITPDGIVQYISANYTYTYGVRNDVNYTLQLLEYNPHPRGTFDFQAATYDNATIINYVPSITIAGGQTIVSYKWDFGDGFNSLLQAPSHRYSTTGAFLVKLNVTDSSGDSLILQKTLNIYSASANFAINLNGTNFYTIDSVQFTLDSTLIGSYTVQSYYWNFTDGASSTLGSPIHRFSSAGTYEVNVTITMTNTDWFLVKRNVTVSSAYVNCNFIVNGSQFYDSDTVKFTANLDFSPTYTVQQYFWDFGDEVASTLISPTHKFVDGTFLVRLNLTMNNGDKYNFTKLMTILKSSVALTIQTDLNETALYVNTELQFFVDAVITGTFSIVEYEWTFGDDSVSYQKNATHKYKTAGTYTVKIKVTMSDGQKYTLSKTITVVNAPTTPAPDPTEIVVKRNTALILVAIVLVAGLVIGFVLNNRRMKKVLAKYMTAADNKNIAQSSSLTNSDKKKTDSAPIKVPVITKPIKIEKASNIEPPKEELDSPTEIHGKDGWGNTSDTVKMEKIDPKHAPRPDRLPIPKSEVISEPIKDEKTVLNTAAFSKIAKIEAKPISDSEILGLMDKEMKDMYRSAQEFIGQGQNSFAQRSYELILNKAKKYNQVRIVSFIEKKIKELE